jgi:hypothetical protein
MKIVTREMLRDCNGAVALCGVNDTFLALELQLHRLTS